MKIIPASFEHLEALASLFDQYRVFYGAASELEAAKQFLQERFQKADSVIFIAQENANIVGFTQLYPSLSSVSLKHIWILNDLFVDKAHRKQGIARLLMHQAEKFAQQDGAVRVILATQVANVTAQSLYSSLGYVKDHDFYHYTRQL